MAPSRIEFALAMSRHRFASRYLPTTSDIREALDAVREDAVLLPIGSRIGMREALKALEALPERVENAREWLAGCQRQLGHQVAQCLADMDKRPIEEVTRRWSGYPRVLEAARARVAAGEIEGPKPTLPYAGK